MNHSVAKFSVALLLTLALAPLSACGGGDTSPEGICNHYLTKIEKVPADKLEGEKKECVEELAGMKKELGDEKWNKFASCVLGAADKDAAKKCEPE
jgi:hypothetical protein